MKKLFILIVWFSITIASLALDRRFGKEYDYQSMSVNTSDEENGISFYNNDLIFSRNDTTYVVEPSTQKKSDKALSDLKYEGQIAYNAKTKTVYFSKDGELYEYSEKTMKVLPLKIEGITKSRTSFEGSSAVYRRWRYKIETVIGLYNPAINENGDILYFSSELDEGKGGRDIWMTTKKSDDSWSKPENVSNVNTEGNEDYPFLSGDSLLFFSSDRLDKFGGWNIYRSGLKDNPSVTLLDEGVNSNGNDYNFIGNKDDVYVVSDRGGNPDIYSPKLKIVETIPVDTVSVDSIPADSTEVGKTPVDTITQPIKSLWETEPCIFYFKFDKDILIKNYDQQIKDYAKFMMENPDKKFIINGYCDIRGSYEYNVGLSNRRCQTIFKRLLAKGVDAKQLKNIGFSNTNLAIPNAANEDEHLLNRRVEIKVVK